MTWANTQGEGKGVASSGCAVDSPVLFASTLMRVQRDFGSADFKIKLWKELDARPDATTTQDAVDNIVLATCAASAKNLTGIFGATWRWPVSDNAKAEAQAKWGSPL